MVLQKRVKASSVRKVGEVLGVSGAYVHDVVKGRRGISVYIASTLGFDPIPPPVHIRKWKLRSKPSLK